VVWRRGRPRSPHQYDLEDLISHGQTVVDSLTSPAWAYHQNPGGHDVGGRLDNTVTTRSTVPDRSSLLD
jgi:hypothetical protein